MKLNLLLPKEAVLTQLYVRDKKQAIKHVAAYAAPLCGLSEKEIYSTLMERESRGSTCMGSSVCIPHGRFDTLKQARAFFARLTQPIDFGAPDGRGIDLMFVLLTPTSSSTEHIKALALISKLLRNKPLCDAIRKAQDADTIYSLLDAASKEDAA